jgi:uncharacterized protein YjeT (DUF2065 family)
MLALVRIAGFIMMVFGIMYLLRPQTVKDLISFFRKGNRIYFGSAIKFLFGIILILASKQCQGRVFINVMGILMLTGGILGLVLGREKVNKLIEFWNTKSSAALRLLGVIEFILGVLIIYAV